MDNYQTFPLTFSHYFFPVLGVYGNPTTNLQTSYGRQVAKTLLNHFAQAPPSLNNLSKLWFPQEQYWNISEMGNEIPFFYSSNIDNTNSNELILDETWIIKFQAEPATIISFHELSAGSDSIVSAIQNINQTSRVSHTAVIVVDQKTYENADAMIVEILKRSGIDSKHLAVSRPGNKAYIDEFLQNLEADLWDDAISHYKSKITKRNSKITFQQSLLQNEDINSGNEVNARSSKNVNSDNSWFYYGRGKLIRHYIKQSYYAECCNESELKKWCIKEAYRQTQTYIKEVAYRHKKIQSSDSDEYIFHNKNWCEAINIMNILCVRMEREAIKERQDSPRVQHLENMIRVLDVSTMNVPYYWWYILCQSLESLLPLSSVALKSVTGVTPATTLETIDHRLLEIAPVHPKHIGAIHYSIAVMLIECAQEMQKAQKTEFNAFYGAELRTTTNSSIWNRALLHLTESESYYANKLWSLRLDSMIGRCLINIGSVDSGIKKLKLAVNAYREKRWFGLMKEVLEIIIPKSFKESKVLSLLEYSSLTKSKYCTEEYMKILDSEDIFLEIDMSKFSHILECNIEFLNSDIPDSKNSVLQATFCSKLGQNIKLSEILFEFEPELPSKLLIENIDLGEQLKLEQVITVPPKHSEIRITKIVAKCKGEKGEINFFWEFSKKDRRAVWLYCLQKTPVDFEFSNKTLLGQAFEGEKFPVELVVHNNSLETIKSAIVVLKLYDKNTNTLLKTKNHDVGTLSPKEHLELIIDLELPFDMPKTGLMLYGVLTSVSENNKSFIFEDNTTISVSNPLVVMCKQEYNSIKVEVYNSSNDTLEIEISDTGKFVLGPSISYIYFTNNDTKTLMVSCKRIHVGNLEFYGFKRNYELLVDPLPSTLSVDLVCNPATTVGKPTQLVYKVSNFTKYSARLIAEMFPVENAVFSGNKRLSFRLLPGQVKELVYTVVFLTCKTLLPRFQVSIASKIPPTLPKQKTDITNPNVIFVSHEQNKLENGIVRNDRKTILVLPG
ncbi:hypothetical protein BB558_000107 [Smittium angustum]|uniref:Trafficking protein particle complex subunit 11 domain-containing protein n=1 Tax=Smittium angustum TaxID=133377 RepID=A0A2U1JFF0_SMIAN|nr:hypothetical protein BB558_000107 [Smittium angustum]